MKMNDIQVLVATMHQTDFSLGEIMNITCDAVFANQANTDAMQIQTANNRTWKMITTNTRGVGLNRNIALLASNAEIILFADDDMTYYEGTFEKVKSAFSEWTDADVIIFSVDLIKNGQIFEKRRVPHKKMHVWNTLKYGTYAIAAKRKSILKKNISFSQFFGGGTIYGSGEDSLFLNECFDKKLNVYSYDYVIGACSKDVSSWFKGYDEKYFFDKGALYGYLFPKLKYLMILYFSLKFNKSELDVSKRLKLMFAGMNAGINLIPYKQE